MTLKTSAALAGMVLLGIFAAKWFRNRSSSLASPLSLGHDSPAIALRQRILDRSMLADTGAPPGTGIRCVVMDWNIDGSNVATLVAFDDGTTSLYYSGGGGLIGAGSHEHVRSAAAEFRSLAATQAEHFTPTAHFDFPPAGHVVLYLVSDSVTTTSGPLSAESLQNDNHPLSALGSSAQRVIHQISLIENAP